jgi:16S rRNA (cytosine967-C5)-methyltransferase
MISPARVVAFEILRLVEQGGYAADLLASRAGGLDSRDAGLAAEIVLGSLRRQAQLDFLIEHFSARTASRLDPEVRLALRMGIYQLRHLDRVPAHAAVNQSVELVKRARKRSAAGLVNTVLRKVHRSPIPWPDRATELSHPAWLLERWDRHFGPETATTIARANLATPETHLRAPDARGWRIQDIGSQSIVPLLGLAPGQSFLDLCAAPGNKTAQALEYGVRAVACDCHWSRLRLMKGLGCELVVLDGTAPLPFACRFDRILVDAPCSGTGTLAHNPEIKWRLQPARLRELHDLQVKLLRNALERLAPGGRLVYSTCSLEPEENDEVVNSAGIPACMVGVHRRLPGIHPGDGFFAAVLTSKKPLND